MDENRTPETEKRVDFRKTHKANRGFAFRLLCIAAVLYWLAELVIAYVKGGPDAPDLTLLIVACIVLGGGAILVAFLTWKTWKLEQEAAALTEEEIRELDALREAEEE